MWIAEDCDADVLCGKGRGQDSIPGWYEVLSSQLQADRVGQKGHLHRDARQLSRGNRGHRIGQKRCLVFGWNYWAVQI